MLRIMATSIRDRSPHTGGTVSYLKFNFGLQGVQKHSVPCGLRFRRASAITIWLCLICNSSFHVRSLPLSGLRDQRLRDQLKAIACLLEGEPSITVVREQLPF
jgi:hypothetical protein